MKMPKLMLQSQDKIAETLLIALYARAVEAQLPNPLLKDERALSLVEQIDYDFSRSCACGSSTSSRRISCHATP
jgi:O-methyltransferase involved in polyketide biosynthesis